MGRPFSSHMKLLQGTRPLKRWRYVAIFAQGLAACAAHVQLGPARQSFWALSLDGRPLRERTRLAPTRGEVQLSPGAPPGAPPSGPGRMVIADRGVLLELALEEGGAIEATCPHGRREVWTRKQAGVRAHGTLALDGAPARAIEARAVIDDTAGYHARRTEWWWSAGVGEGADGAALAWNLVSGVNDPEHGSERAVWIDGRPTEAPPVSFSSDLRQILAADGSRLRFSAQAERAHSQSLIVLKSDYRAPFGAFSGTLPGGVALAQGLGVVEHHRALW